MMSGSLSRTLHACAKARHVLDWHHRRQAARFNRLRDDYYRLFWQDAARLIGADLEDAGHGILKIHKEGRWTFVRQHEVMVDSRLGLQMAGNKPFVLRLLGRHGCPTPRHVEFDLTTVRRAGELLRRLGRSLVVKPATGAGGLGVTTRIDRHAGLLRASIWAAAFSRHLIAEEQVPGQSYRLLYLDGRCIDAIRRDPPVVFGDGTRTIRELIAAENTRRLESRSIMALSPLTVDLDCRFTLRAVGLTLQDVPSADERIIVKSVANQNSSREQYSVRDQVHPAVVQLGLSAAKALGLEFVGIDIMTPDIGIPLEDSGGALIEINTTPSLHHHALVSSHSDAVPVGALVLERLLACQTQRRVLCSDAIPDHADRLDKLVTDTGRRAGQPSSPVVARVNPDDLRSFSLQIVSDCGAVGPQAELFVKILVWNDLVGRSTHGVWRLGTYCKRFLLGLIQCPCQPVFRQTGPAIGLLDGDRGFGPYVGHVAMQRAMDLARDAGTGLVCVSNSNHFAAAAYYVQLAAQEGMIGLAMSNSTPKVAAFGGVRPVFGTNPLAFGAPRRGGRSVLVDMATSASSGAHVIECMENGAPLPQGVAIDAEGRPTTDATRASQGALLPFGGAKGYGVALMVEILSGVISGAGISHQVGSMFQNFESNGHNGHFFMALNVAHFMPLETYYDRLETLIDLIRQSGEDGDAHVSIPGEGRWAAHERASREGICLDERIAQVLEKLANAHHVQIPWHLTSDSTRAAPTPAHAGDSSLVHSEHDSMRQDSLPAF